MPNWCFSSAVISAKTEKELEEFLKFIRTKHISYHRDFATHDIEGETYGVFWNFCKPEDINAYFYGSTPTDEQPDKKIEPEWYEWNMANWGTKWDIYPPMEDEAHIIKDPNGNNYFFVWNFKTAWSPPEPMYREMAVEFPNLTFEYEVTEEANFYAGKVLCQDGEVVISDWVDDPSHDDFKNLGVTCIGCSDDESNEPCYLRPSEEPE